MLMSTRPPLPTEGRASTFYGPGRVTTQTGGGRGSYDYADVLDELIRRRLRGPVAPVAPQATPMRGGGNAAVAGPVTRFRGGADPLAGLRLASEGDKLAASIGTAPTKYVTVGGQSFLTKDPLAMNPYQLQAFEPQSSTLAVAPTDQHAGDSEFDRFAKASPGRLDSTPVSAEDTKAAAQQQYAHDMLALSQRSGGGGGGGRALTPASTAMPVGSRGAGGRTNSMQGNSAARQFYSEYGRWPTEDELARAEG